uniref:VWFC domain-containing protein n=1 Tax=Biomphalaria glabrata TaxID=6526 RepID=A0A2C9KFB6_BIOGL
MTYFFTTKIVLCDAGGCFLIFSYRCPYYVPENKLCTIVTDPFDACCKVPSCPLSVTNPPSSIYLEPKLVYSIVKGPSLEDLVAAYSTTRVTTTIATTVTTTPMSTYDPHHSYRPQSANFLPTMPPGTVANPNSSGRCHYGSQSYREGDRWTVGCDLNCLCVNAMTNLYVCDHM